MVNNHWLFGGWWFTLYASYFKEQAGSLLKSEQEMVGGAALE